MTTRSRFKIEQFEKRLQEYAHQIPKFERVVGEVEGLGTVEITFRYEDGKPGNIRVHVREKTGTIRKYGDYEWEGWDSWGLVIEPKAYMDSQHSTRISNGEEKALEWLNKLMEGIEPEPRFKISDALKR